MVVVRNEERPHVKKNFFLHSMGFEPMQLSLSELETDPLDQLGHECNGENVTWGVLGTPRRARTADIQLIGLTL